MKLSKMIKRYFTEELCYPSDFFWVDICNVKKQWNENKGALVIALMMYYIFAILAFVGYYLLLPFGILHKWCEEWCYR